MKLPAEKFIIFWCKLDLTRFVVAEFAQLSGYSHGVGDEDRQVASNLTALAKEWISRYPKVRAIILECVEASPYADTLKLETGLPVFDAVTICKFLTCASEEHPDGQERNNATVRALGCLCSEGLRKDDFHMNARFEVKHRCVEGLTLEMCKTGELTPDVATSLKIAITSLEADGVIAITAQFPLLLHLQGLARDLSNVPVFMSPLVMCPLLSTFAQSEGQLLVVCANSVEFGRSMDAYVDKLGIAAQADRLIIAGVERLPGADKIEVGMPAEHELFEPKLVELAIGFVAEASSTIRAVLLEALPLARHADVLRQRLGLPVFDAALLCEFYHTGQKGISIVDVAD